LPSSWTIRALPVEIGLEGVVDAAHHLALIPHQREDRRQRVELGNGVRSAAIGRRSHQRKRADESPPPPPNMVSPAPEPANSQPAPRTATSAIAPKARAPLIRVPIDRRVMILTPGPHRVRSRAAGSVEQLGAACEELLREAGLFLEGSLEVLGRPHQTGDVVDARRVAIQQAAEIAQ
jgi:hypothetical protein